ncbi:MAG: hypothetical protein PHX80_03775 [Candidatus Nanoarchaeia archaeon]|nr:hypothetical protein [Candidatus Nanoarchaeia archaeon]
MKISIDVEDLTVKQAKEQLSALIEALDDLSSQDFFGTEGWRHFMGFDE